MIRKKDYWKNGSYAPANSDGKFNGKMSLQDALGVSKIQQQPKQ